MPAKTIGKKPAITRKSKAVTAFAGIPAESGRTSGEFRSGLSHESPFQRLCVYQSAGTSC